MLEAECGKMQTRMTPNMDTFDAVMTYLEQDRKINFQSAPHYPNETEFNERRNSSPVISELDTPVSNFSRFFK